MSRRCGLTIVETLVVIAILAVLLGFLVSATETTHCGGPRTLCSNHLRQVALALQQYEGAYRALPPAYTVDAQGRPLHSWRTLILPYLDQQALYDTIDLTKPWNDPVHATARATSLSTYLCPLTAASPGHTTYRAVAGPGRYLAPAGRARRLAEITDGPSRTLALVEVPEAQAVPWMSPLDATDALMLSLGRTGQPALPHPGVIQVAFGDGVVNLVASDAPDARRRAWLTIDGGETISEDDVP
jgi:type II secretory pathway pseudopilin PulG